ncbi:MAG: helix-turn-helix transcriptional regulator [Solirubrobacterales bacterium]|nr:helix-turn-helix transcriptional regulator [Solirubrobacterales bacterium]
MLYHDYPGQECSIAASLEVVGERWSLLIIRDVLRGRRRFDRIQSSLGIARNVLTKRLNRLVEAGILEKRAYQSGPERFEYFLTNKGLDLWPVLMSLVEWGDRYCDSGTGRALRIVHKNCGGEVDGRRICEKCGAHLTVQDAESVPA